MNTFHLTIVTPDGCKFDGEAESVSVRSTEGSIQVLANHMDYVTTLGMGPAFIGLNGERKEAACIGGMLSVTNKVVRLIATTFEWAEEIDVERAQNALNRAEDQLAKADISPADKALSEAAKQRALVRLSCANAKKN